MADDDDVDDAAVVVVVIDDGVADEVVEFGLVTLELIDAEAVVETTALVLTAFNTFFASSTGVTSTSLMASGLLVTSPWSKSKTRLAGVAISNRWVARAEVGVNFPWKLEAGGVFLTSHANEVGLWGGGVFSYSHFNLNQSAERDPK